MSFLLALLRILILNSSSSARHYRKVLLDGYEKIINVAGYDLISNGE